MSEFDEFSRRATFCLTFAVTISDPGYRAALLDMAERWRQLAEQAKQREKSPAQTAQAYRG
jgi:hypothetical protein